MVGLAGKNCEDTTAEFSEEAALIMKNLWRWSQKLKLLSIW